MTKEDIKKALEVCIDIYATCDDCLYNGVENCDDRMRTDALKLIIEQENEIERLRTTLGQCNTELNSALESLKSQCREIGELKAGTKQAKIDVLNEAKELSVHSDQWNCKVVPIEYIDELIKEIENETR